MKFDAEVVFRFTYRDDNINGVDFNDVINHLKRETENKFSHLGTVTFIGYGSHRGTEAFHPVHQGYVQCVIHKEYPEMEAPNKEELKKIIDPEVKKIRAELYNCPKTDELQIKMGVKTLNWEQF